LRGIEVSEENLGYDTICNAIFGGGHFLGSGQTHAAMERDYHYPKLAHGNKPVQKMLGAVQTPAPARCWQGTSRTT